jgi:linoleoyl-CoA desaturase
MAFTAGIVLAIVFQLAHVVEESEFIAPEKNEAIIQSEWAIFQIKTTANFATRSKVLSWLLGGLNFQVEHHLFPKISHIHYPKINQIVKDTCREFGVEYREYPTMLSAVRSHIVHMKHVGQA